MIEENIEIGALRGHQALVTTAPWLALVEDGELVQANGVRLHEGMTGELVQIVDDEGLREGDYGNLIVWVYSARDSRLIHRNCLTITSAPKPAPKIVIPPDVAAHVLFPFKGIGYRAGSFINALIEALVRADATNRTRLGLAYPEYAEAVRLAKDEWTGIDQLKRIMRGE